MRKIKWIFGPFSSFKVIAIGLSREGASKLVGSSGNDDLKLFDFPGEKHES